MLNLFRSIILAATILILLLISMWWLFKPDSTPNWSEDEIKILRSLWIANLPATPINTSNAVADNIKAAEFGYKLFFDTRLSAHNNISCANCHKPEIFFTDGLPVAQGTQIGTRNSPTLVGIVYSPWFFLDGRKDSLWSQALAPLESSIEHAGTRMQYAHMLAKDEHYRMAYESLFGPLPDLSDRTRFPPSAGPVKEKIPGKAWLAMRAEDKEAVTKIFTNIGKAIAAYERLLLPGESRFDQYIEKLINKTSNTKTSLTAEEANGLKLFINKAQCINCHNGPLFTNNEFHNTGLLPSTGNLPSVGRARGIRILRNDPFNCLGQYNDAEEKDCAELLYAKSGYELIGSHKVPSLRNIAETAPYMHAGQLNTLLEAIDHYNQAPESLIGHNETKPLGLSRREKQQLVAFLATLSAPIASDKKWLKPPN